VRLRRGSKLGTDRMAEPQMNRGQRVVVFRASADLGRPVAGARRETICHLVQPHRSRWGLLSRYVNV